jgi:voltage-gated potassium channel
MVLSALIILICGYQLRITEAPITQYSGIDLGRLDNAMWCIVVTMLTLGYGDYYPDTDAGRIIAGFACFSAIILKSLVVITLTTILELD